MFYPILSQEKAAGTPDFQINSNFQGAVVAKEKEHRALLQVCNFLLLAYFLAM